MGAMGCFDGGCEGSAEALGGEAGCVAVEVDWVEEGE